MLASNITTIPAAWSSSSSPNPSSLSNGTNGNTNDALPSSFLDGKFVRTVFGLVPLRFALDWPVMGSYDELAGCAAWMGGRIPTFEEARSIYAYVDDMKTKDIMKSKLANKVPAVNG